MPPAILRRGVQIPETVLELRELTAALLAGGLGSRLRSVVGDRPKALADISGRPFLTYLFDQLVAAGVRDVVLCTGYRGDQVRMLFGECYGPLSLRYSEEPKALGTAGALKLALPLFKSNPVLVLNGDSYCEANLKEFCDSHSRRRANATLVLTKVADTQRFGRVQISGDETLSAFEEKNSEHGPGWINAGIYLIKHDLLAEIPVNRPVSLESEVFPNWIGRGLYGFQSEARFMDIGTPEAYAGAQSFFAAGLPR